MASTVTLVELKDRGSPGLARRPGRGGLGVFSDNRFKPIHRWYPFVEGYSADLVSRALGEMDGSSPVTFDPFGGSGTTSLAASLAGVDSFYCEVNPYLAWVAEVKVNQARAAASRDDLAEIAELADKLDAGFRPPGTALHPLVYADQRRNFFPPGVARDAVSLLAWISGHLEGPVAQLAALACTTSLIPASNMVRRTDLRRRRLGDPQPVPFLPSVAAQLRAIYEDVRYVGAKLQGAATRLGDDVRRLEATARPFELIVTSPPYLNGTNYCRNTKLELLALRLLESEENLATLRTESICAGINNVSARRADPEPIPSVEAIGRKLDATAYDPRIPRLVRLYFSDMKRAFAAVRRNAATGARLLLDIGDSRFAGVHIPTHELLCDVAEAERWRLQSVETLRKRKSYDGTELTQVLLDMRAT